MPSKNIVKHFESDAMYHVYNRGNNKRIIFKDKRDFAVFLSFLKYALMTNEDYSASEQIDSNMISASQRFNLRRLGLRGRLELVSYCLMPNHYHLLFYQYDPGAITALMRSVATGYSMYFNKRYNGSGGLFQGVYKATRIVCDENWEHISRYIHLNPIDLGEDYKDYDYSSYKYYIGEARADWIKPEKGTSFESPDLYKKFVEDWLPYRNEIKGIKEVIANSKELE